MKDDTALVARAQHGDANAFAQLYDRHLDAIYRYILLRVSTREQAEDLTEDVFLKAWQKIGSYRPERPFLHWLYRIAHNRTVDAHRRKAQHELSLDALTEVGMHPSDPNPSPLTSAITQEELQHLRQALATMSPDEQTLLTLRFTEGMSFQDIAPVLNKSTGACRVLQHRALKKLAGKLTPAPELSHA